MYESNAPIIFLLLMGWIVGILSFPCLWWLWHHVGFFIY